MQRTDDFDGLLSVPEPPEVPNQAYYWAMPAIASLVVFSALLLFAMLTSIPAPTGQQPLPQTQPTQASPQEAPGV